MQPESDLCSTMAINVGSSSIKISVFNRGERVDVNINFIGLQSQLVKLRFSKGLSIESETYSVTVGDDLLKAAGVIVNKVKDVLESLKWSAPKKIGHRVKFAGFGPSVQGITKHQEQILEFNDYLSSRHNSLCLAVIHETKKIFPNAMQLMVRDQAVNDFSLHAKEKIPFVNSIVRRYGLYSSGYHGLAIKACLEELKDKYRILKFTGVICQIGSGVSVSVVVDGVVKFNTMQFAACDGPIMHNRSGTQPVGLVLRLLKYGVDAGNLPNLFNRESGIYGLAGLSANSDVTVENILSDNSLKSAKDSYLLSIATELFKAISLFPEVANFVFSGGLATKHKWIGPELLYRAKAISRDSSSKLTQQFEKGHVFANEDQRINVVLVDIDEQNMINNEMKAYSFKERSFNFSAGACEVPGTSVGFVREGVGSWGAGNICLSLSNSAFSFDTNNLPEAFIFFGGNRNAFFIRAIFARATKVPAIFIEDSEFDARSIINKKIILDTPTRMAFEL